MSRIGSVNNRGRSIKTDILGTNQLYQAEDYALEMKEKYKGVDFTLTGHSLGEPTRNMRRLYGHVGCHLQRSVGHRKPLPEARRKAENGEFDSQIINFAHPGDIIASGALGGFDGHVGSTYYIDSSYKDANDGLSIKEKLIIHWAAPIIISLTAIDSRMATFRTVFITVLPIKLWIRLESLLTAISCLVLAGR